MDDMSASSINEATVVREKLTYETLDCLFESARTLATATEVSASVACPLYVQCGAILTCRSHWL